MLPGVVFRTKNPSPWTGGVEQAGAGLDRALRELPDRQRPPRAESDLGFTQARAQRLGHQVAEIDQAGLEARRVEVGQVVAHHVDRGGRRVERGKRRGK